MQRPIKILVVEDNPGDAELVARALAKCRHGSDVFHAGCRRDAIDALSHEEFDIVLLDLSLPDSKGLAALHMIRTNHPQIPVINLTSLDDRDTALKAIEACAQDYLIKDKLTSELLERSMSYAIQRQQQAAE